MRVACWSFSNLRSKHSGHLVTIWPRVSFWQIITDIMTWISSYIHNFLRGVITNACPHVNVGSAKPLFKVRTWINNYIPLFIWMFLLIHAINSMLLQIISVCWSSVLDESIYIPQGLYSLSGKTSYYQILWSLVTARSGVEIVVSLGNLSQIQDKI